MWSPLLEPCSGPRDPIPDGSSVFNFLPMHLQADNIGLQIPNGSREKLQLPGRSKQMPLAPAALRWVQAGVSGALVLPPWPNGLDWLWVSRLDTGAPTAF